MIEIWMRNHLVSDNNCKIRNIILIILGLHLVLVVVHGNLQLVGEQVE